jgi:peptidyl-prolyl cis-trans isomerase SurA
MRAIFPSTTSLPARRLPGSRRAAAILAVSLLAAGSPAAGQPTGATAVNGVILRVNDRIVTLFDYRERLLERQRGIERAEIPADERRERLERAPADVLRELLDESLLLSRGDQLAVEIEDDRLQRALENARRNFGIENEQQFEQAMAQSGMTREEFRTRVRDQLVYQEVLGQEVHSKIEIKEEELMRDYRARPADFTTPVERQVREFVVLDQGPAGPVPADEQAALAATLGARVRAGEPMAEVVAASAAAGSTSGAIELGWVRPGDLDAALERAIAELAPGGVTAPVPGRGGLHVLQLVARREAKLRPFSEVKEEMEDAERIRRFQGELEKYMARLEAQAFIVADPPAEAAGFRRTTPTEPELPELRLPAEPTKG